ncbi:hypothetical protein M409DRAFT_58653 [Zasmidium cellare ATCC 36951]|uniref:Uncharacterized protein n=1 Tax=Zasmidium cellare ATCC 36951 TaxID=1080233 RepID=A0A6A6C7J4_ZASCE|nr:uncharacterized protein M409DRAFT_58653 [Zasmidium cellare ATCC 36951]KAF2161872.1 hypothetical protein M409DRAFT_58653 [Zasmidium cellare ATCC 36951]
MAVNRWRHVIGRDKHSVQAFPLNQDATPALDRDVERLSVCLFGAAASSSTRAPTDLNNTAHSAITLPAISRGPACLWISARRSPSRRTTAACRSAQAEWPHHLAAFSSSQLPSVALCTRCPRSPAAAILSHHTPTTIALLRPSLPPCSVPSATFIAACCFTKPCRESRDFGWRSRRTVVKPNP